MLISSPPRVPCSTSQSSPVVGCSVAAWMLRWPMDQISGLTPSLPTNGLSFGIVPSALMRTILPSGRPAAAPACGPGDRAIAERDEQRSVARRTPGGRRSAAPSSASASGGRSPARRRHAARRRSTSLPRATAVLFAAVARLGIAPVDEAVLREGGVDAPRRAGRPGRGRRPAAGRRPAPRACRPRRPAAGGRASPSPASAAGQEGKPPRVVEPFGNGDDVERDVGLATGVACRSRRGTGLRHWADAGPRQPAVRAVCSPGRRLGGGRSRRLGGRDGRLLSGRERGCGEDRDRYDETLHWHDVTPLPMLVHPARPSVRSRRRVQVQQPRHSLSGIAHPSTPHLYI